MQSATVDSTETGVRGTRRCASTLVGRERELELLVDTAAEPPALAILEGEAGIGKTRLLNEALASSALSWRRRLVGRCHAVGDPLPLGPFVEALCGLAGDLPPGPVNPVIGALRPLLPELASMLPTRPDALGDPRLERHRLLRAIGELLAVLGPTVLALEDFHWADPESLEMLELLLARPPANLSIILTYRGEELGSDDPLLGLVARLPGELSRETISLRSLGAEDVRRLASAILADGEVSEQLGCALHRSTAGVPFAVEELTRLLGDRGQLVPRDGSWECDDPSSLGVPSAIGDSVRQRLARVGVDARLMAEASAVIGAPAPEKLLAAVAGLSASRARSGLSRALTSGHVREVGEGAFELRHALAQQAVYEGIPTPERQALHLRAARELRGGETPDTLARVARQFKKAGRPRLWLRYAERAAAAAQSVGEDRRAARLLEEAIMTPNISIAARARMAAKLGDAALFGRSPRHAIGILSDVLEERSLRPGVKGELRFCLARLLYQVGDAVRGHEEMVRSTRELRRRPPRAALAMANLASTWPTGDGADEGRAWLGRAIEASRRQDDPAVTTHVVASQAVLLLEAGDPAGWRVTEDIPWRARSSEQGMELVRACKYLATTAALLGYCGRAQALVAKANKMRTELGNERFGVGLATVQGELDWVAGRWAGLEARARTLVEASPEARIMRGRSELLVGRLLLSRGELEEAEDMLSAALGAFRVARAGSPLLAATAGLVRVHLARGDAGAARGVARLALQSIQSNRIWALTEAVVPAIVEALLSCPADVDARGVATELERGLRGRDAPAGRASLAVCRGLIAEAEGRRQAAARWFGQAENAWTRLPCPYEAARARERRGDALLGDGESAGRAFLLAALDDFETLGATWDAARTRALLRTHGVSLPYPWRGGRRRYGCELSPRELEVAELAGMGRTSPEIARVLFLSPRTVESHVSSAMRKLGVSSRRELGPASKRSTREGKAANIP